MMILSLAALLLFAAQPDEAPVATATPEAAAAEPPPSERKATEPAPEPLETPKAAAPKADASGPAFDRRTKVDGGALQVVFGDRAVFHLGDRSQPQMDKVEKGQLAVAHPAGAVKERFDKPDAGRIAIALDGSAEKKASYLKIWNGLDYPVIYKAGILVLHNGVLEPSQVRVCAVPAGQTHYETWPRPVVAVALGGFTKAATNTVCQ
jgi:hypothetical protein